ncbi:MAG TPA: hypothetical protein VFZ83_13200 [Acidimicrobiia bacterium]|nr:hypothetical protein [Acidimicrobiia bacterium]
MSGPRKLLSVAAIGVAGWFGVGALGDATQTRPDERHDDVRTEVVISVESKGYRQDLTTGAYALWATCSATVDGSLVEPGIVAVDGVEGTYRFAIRPSIGEYGRERLTGCLRDLTVERLRSSVVSVTDVPDGGTGTVTAAP